MTTDPVILFDARADRRSRVRDVIRASDTRVLEVDGLDTALAAARDGHLAVIAIGSVPEQGVGWRLVRELRAWSLRVIAYEDGVDGWRIQTRCRVLLAGATELLDSRRADFGSGLETALQTLQAARLRERRHDDAMRADMRRLGLVGQSRALMDVIRRARQVSMLSDVPVLITGETGTGKERIARAIHALDPKRCRAPFVPVNCAAISPTLAESELFGHRRGAFTGAIRDRLGLIRAAEGGVLFLDEIGELEEALQAKLLRVLQENRVLGVGEEIEVDVDVRIIAATNRDLTQMIADRRFRPDLYYRLGVLGLHVPPLRERPEDLAALVHHFCRVHASLCRVPAPVIGAEFIEALTSIRLPGNARQVENLVRQVLVGRTSMTPLGLTDLPPEIWLEVSDSGDRSATSNDELVGQGRREVAEPVAVPPPEEPEIPAVADLNISRSMVSLERRLLAAAMQRTGGNRSQTAQLLGITPRSVYNLLRRHQLSPSVPC